MDSAEIWLLQNDPDYAETSQGWKHVDGQYTEIPGQEVPFGSEADLSMLVEENKGRWLPRPEHRICEGCRISFVPMVPWHRFCEEKCQHRALMRKRRKGQNA